MKALFIGDGTHDVGAPEFCVEARAATGVVPTLTRKILPKVSADSVALTWIEIGRYAPDAKRGYDAKVRAAELLATRRYDCDALVCVADADGDRERRAAALARGAGEAVIPIAFGIAVEAIEAWTLGAPDAIARELEVEAGRVRKKYPTANV